MDTHELLAQLHEALAQAQQARDSQAADERVEALTQTEFQFAARDYDRYPQLSQANVIPAQQLDEYRTKMDSERSLLAAAGSKVVADRAIAAAVASAERLQAQLNDRELKAPVRGGVLYKLAERGEVLPPGGNVVTIIDLTDVYMTEV